LNFNLLVKTRIIYTLSFISYIIFLVENGNEIRDHLRAETGQEHVPYLFIGGKLIKSEDALVGLKKPGSIKTILENSGVKVTGFFRT